MTTSLNLERLREVITESLRIQRDGERIDYISSGTDLQDASAKQNHIIFARRGCGKTLLLHHSARMLRDDTKSIYLNCEDFKRHSFPNVLIEILNSIFREIDKSFFAWFGRKKKAKQAIGSVLTKLAELQRAADIHEEEVRRKDTAEQTAEDGLSAEIALEQLKVGATIKDHRKDAVEVERSFRLHREKLQELDRWLPQLKEIVREFFAVSSRIRSIIIQVDDLYHLKRTDQAFVVDYLHRLCKDVPLYFKIATLRHASTLYVERDGQPIGVQERHDYQPINIDYTFSNFKKTSNQNKEILEKFGVKAGIRNGKISSVFKGEGFTRLVMAGGGVPRDFLSLFLLALTEVDAANGGRIGKDEVRQISRGNFETKIEELKQDSRSDEQTDLIKGIYIIRKFCLDRKTNIFLVEERVIQQHDAWRALIYRLLDYRIIHSCGTALTHKSSPGTYQAFAIDIGCYAHLRKLDGRFNEIDVGLTDAKEKMRSAPIFQPENLQTIISNLPLNIEEALSTPPEE